MYSFRLLVSMFMLAALGVGSAAAYDYGVSESWDEFTNEYSCRQRVDNSLHDDTGIALSYTHSLGHVVGIYRDYSSDPNTWVWNSTSTLPLSSDLIYLRFPDGEVVTRAPDLVNVETGIQRTDIAYFMAPLDLIVRILASPSDLRIRFSGTHGNRDFTILHSVVTSLAAGYGQTCIR